MYTKIQVHFQQDAAPRFHVSDQIRPEEEVK